MKKIKIYYLSLFFLFICSVNGIAQIDKTFWFAAPDIANNHGDFPVRFIISALGNPVTVTISQPANPSFNLGASGVTITPTPTSIVSGNGPITIPANSAIKIEFNNTFPNVESIGNGNSGNSGKDNSGFLIQSTDLVTVYYEVEGGGGPFNGDLFSLKGNNGLGNKFIIVSQKTGVVRNSTYAGQPYNRAYVVATEDNTTITVKASVSIVGPSAGGTTAAGGTFTVNNLMKGEVYVISAAGFSGPDHLGGTIVESDKPVAITLSDDSVQMPSSDNSNFSAGIDLNGDQLVPVSLAGELFITLPGNLGGTIGNAGIGSGPNDYIYIYPVDNGTTLKVNGTNFGGVKNTGEFWEIKNGTSSTQGGTQVIESIGGPVLVYQLGGTWREVGGGVIPQINCTGSQQVTVFRGGANWHSFYLNILCKTVDVPNFSYTVSTGTMPTVSFSPVPNITGWSFAKINVGGDGQSTSSSGSLSSGTLITISNSSGAFHLGTTGGNDYFVTRVGYFSNFGSISGKIENVGTTICETGKAELTATIPGGASAYQWSRNGVVLPQFTGDSVITCRPGNYRLVATTNNGCSGTLDFPLNFSRCRYACVDNLKVSLNGKCQYTLGLTEAVLPSDCLEAPDYYLVVNDANPSNGAIIDGISPASGWTYGVFLNLDNGKTELICQGRIVVTDDMGPIFTSEQKKAWETIDTVITWADNVDEILNVPSSWWGNSIGYQQPPTFAGSDKYYTGRPYLTDSCEINNCGALGSQGTWLIDKDSSGTASLRDSFSLHRSCNLQYKVTDYLEHPQCDSTKFQYKLRRTFEIIDQRGNRTFLNQIIYFKRPDLRKTNTNRFAREFVLNTDPLDRGPGNLGQFGPFGNGPRKVHAHYGEVDNIPSGGLIDFRDKLGADQMSTANYSLNVDTISYNTSLGTCGSFDAQTELKSLLTSIYVAVDTLPSGRIDSISLFSNKMASSYDLSFQYKEFTFCNHGKSYEVVTEIFDWCTGLREKDTLVIRIMDQSAPVFEPYQASGLGGIIKGRVPNDSIILPVGVSDCSASLRLPAKSGTRTNLRDLSSLFNWGVYDKCSGGNTTTDRNGTGVTLNYKFETRDVWNDRFFKDRANYEPVNYTQMEMNGGLVALGLPIGEHRLIIEAWDGCNNAKKDTLYFDVEDKTAPVMLCKDQINVSLTSNSTGNYYLRNSESNRELIKDQGARVWVKDVDKGSRDNCTLDSMYIRRRIDWATCSAYLVWNMDYDRFGNNNGVVDEHDFEAISGSNLRYTPKYMQYVEVFCCDGSAGTQVMYELWGSDLVQGILGNSDNNAPGGRSWSFCWGNIQVEDKTAPVVTAPNLNKSYNARAKNWIDCTEKEGIGTSSNRDGIIADEIRSNAIFGFPDIYGLECKGSVVYSVMKALTCDTGTITRKWVVNKAVGDGITLKDSATQTIYVRANHNFTITIPADQSATCSSKAGTDVILDETGCDLLAVSYSESKYDAAPGDPFCYKVYRTATVINWCMVPNYFTCSSADPGAYAVRIPRNTGSTAVTYTFTLSSASTERIQDASSARTGGSSVLVKGGTISSAGESLIAGGTTTSGFSSPATSNCYTKPGFAYQYTQVIKVMDNVKPIVASGTDWTPATAEADVKAGINWNKTKNSFSISGKLATPSCVAKIKLSFAASDACATNDLELEKTELLRRGTNHELEGTVLTGKASSTTNGLFTVELSGVPVGEYDLRVTVRDDCGNVTVSRLAVDVEDNKAPAPVCVQNLTASFMPDGQGGCMAVIHAKDVFQDVNRNWDSEECSPSVVATIAKVTNGVAGTKSTTLTLTGADKDGVVASVYLTDAAGNENYCTVNIFLEDHVCQPSAPVTIAGAIQTESKVTVEGVQVNLSGESQKNFATGVNGSYVFSNLIKGMDYTVTPSLNKGFLNGVSTYDLILISKHILGNQPLNTPYKLIAADVNNSKSITTLDMIQLRKLILNIEASFPSNQSWRFVDASYTFPNPSNPWATSFPEVKNVNDLNGTQTANFVAIKVGDVNGNAIANSTQGSIRNLTANLGIQVADMNLVAGNEYKVDFTAVDLSGVEGFQFTLNLDKKGLELVDMVPGIAGEEHFGLFTEEGVITASWHGEAKGGVLFSLVVRAREHINLSEVLNLNSRYTAAEAYKDGEVMNVGLNFNASKSSANYALYQNTPNPFAGETIIGFNLPLAGAATLTIQDVTGRTLKVINGEYAKGYNQIILKSKELKTAGVLTYTLKAADYTLTKKMIVVE